MPKEASPLPERPSPCPTSCGKGGAPEQQRIALGIPSSHLRSRHCCWGSLVVSSASGCVLELGDYPRRARARGCPFVALGARFLVGQGGLPRSPGRRSRNGRRRLAPGRLKHPVFNRLPQTLVRGAAPWEVTPDCPFRLVGTTPSEFVHGAAHFLRSGVGAWTLGSGRPCLAGSRFPCRGLVAFVLGFPRASSGRASPEVWAVPRLSLLDRGSEFVGHPRELVCGAVPLAASGDQRRWVGSTRIDHATDRLAPRGPHPPRRHTRWRWMGVSPCPPPRGCRRVHLGLVLLSGAWAITARATTARGGWRE